MNADSTDARHDADLVLVVDIGGSQVKVGTTGNRRAPLFAEPTPKDAERALNLVAALSKEVSRMVGRAERPRLRLVCGSGGLVTTTGVCTKALYTPFSGVDIRNELIRRLNSDVYVLNDASLQAHALLESATNGLLISIGTGVGGAIISDGRVLSGARGFAGEIGHALTAYSTIVCGCGRVGCLDTVASGFAFNQILGSDWFNQTEGSIASHLETLAAGVADSAMACVALLDVNTIILAGWPARYPLVREALRSRLKKACRKLAFYRNGWSLSVLGARQIDAKHWRNND
jgi:predicted NBD/HSP70 family sugar kinase